MLEARQDAEEKQREASLLALFPARGKRALDVGARDGYYARHLCDHYTEVVALDLEKPDIDHPGITAVAGDVTALDFDDKTFDFVLCAEVLEHIPPPALARAARELARVTGQYLLIGVPCEQDLRIDRSTCRNCGAINPPWGHVNSFSLERLKSLFAGLEVVDTEFVGRHLQATNALTVWLLDRARNPYGSYIQDEPCVQCNGSIGSAGELTLVQRVLCKIAYTLRGVQELVTPPGPRWTHVLFRKGAGNTDTKRAAQTSVSV